MLGIRSYLRLLYSRVIGRERLGCKLMMLLFLLSTTHTYLGRLPTCHVIRNPFDVDARVVWRCVITFIGRATTSSLRFHFSRPRSFGPGLCAGQQKLLVSSPELGPGPRPPFINIFSSPSCNRGPEAGLTYAFFPLLCYLLYTTAAMAHIHKGNRQALKYVSQPRWTVRFCMTRASILTAPLSMARSGVSRSWCTYTDLWTDGAIFFFFFIFIQKMRFKIVCGGADRIPEAASPRPPPRWMEAKSDRSRSGSLLFY